MGYSIIFYIFMCDGTIIAASVFHTGLEIKLTHSLRRVQKN